MNQFLSMLQAARISPAPRAALYSDHMLAELAALHEEMIVQLRLERLDGANTRGFIASMTGQHERAAAALRSQLAHLHADPAHHRASATPHQPCAA